MKKIIIITALLSIGLRTVAQTSNGLAFPSPNNSFLGSVTGTSASSPVSVDLYTGTALAEIPICHLASKVLTVPISINYVGGRGIKVQDYPTCVGLGWQLTAGGSISRVVRCFPDEQSNGYLGTGLWGQKVASAAINGNPFPSQVTGGTGVGSPTADGEPDIYYVKTPFFAFQFTFDENGNAVISNSNGIKIRPIKFFDSYVSYNSSFEVIDGQGNRYFFGSSSQSKENTTTELFGTDYTFPTTWYLDKIVKYNSADSIIFNYTSLSSSDILYHYQSSTTYDQWGNHKIDSLPIQNTVNNPKVITNIISTLGEVDFTYAMDRRDDIDAARLASITLKSYNPETHALSSLLQTFDFHSSYFGDPSNDADKLRLKLDSITVSGNGSGTVSPLTISSFTYNLAKNLPSRKSLSAVDFWGYNSYMSNPNPDKYSVLPNPEYAEANILTGIKDIKGGTYQISYESNTYYNTESSTTIQVGGVRVNKISHTSPTGENVFTLYQYLDNNGHSSGQILSNAYMINVIYEKNQNGVILYWKTLSESPSNFYDLNGNFIGYSYVKVLNQNGGYTQFHFSNFSDPEANDILNYVNGGPGSIPDVTSSISFAYKRGLLLSKTIFNSSSNKIAEDSYSYTSLTNPLQKKSWAYHVKIYSLQVGGYSSAVKYGSTYWTNVENYRLTQTIHKDYDQLHPANYVQTTTNYTYSSNKRMVKSIASTDSKGNNHTQTFYYPDDSSIPMINSGEQAAISTMLAANRTNVLIHSISDDNGIVHQTHNSYGIMPYGYDNKVFLLSKQEYSGSTLENQVFYNYDISSAQPLSSFGTGNKPVSTRYGYNSSLPVVRVENAINTVKYTNSIVSTRKTYYVPPLNGGSYQTQFTTAAAGTITLTIPPGTYLGSNGGNGVTCFFSFYLSGPASKSGNLCNNSASNYTCSEPNSVSYTNMPAGTYTLNIMPSTNTSTVDVPFDYTFPDFSPSRSDSTEFYYQSFEEVTGATQGGAHTGKSYWDGDANYSYSVNYTPPNNRSYIIQWWSLVSGKWNMNETTYSGPRTITGKIDDIRIFPTDAQMTTYTYSPLVGKTGETGPAGHTTTYEYDGLGRLVLTRNDEGNILSKTCYHYEGQPEGCKVFYNHVKSQAFTRNNCPDGYQGTDVTYTVPANTYISTLSQEDADGQAQADINANGQAYANSNGSCIAAPPLDVTVYNSTSQSFSLILTNTSTNQQYYFNIQPNQNGQVVGQIPSGVYDAYIGPSGGGSDLYTYQIYTYYESGVTIGEAYDLYLTCGACPMVSIDNY